MANDGWERRLTPNAFCAGALGGKEAVMHKQHDWSGTLKLAEVGGDVVYRTNQAREIDAGR